MIHSGSVPHSSAFRPGMANTRYARDSCKHDDVGRLFRCFAHEIYAPKRTTSKETERQENYRICSEQSDSPTPVPRRPGADYQPHNSGLAPEPQVLSTFTLRACSEARAVDTSHARPTRSPASKHSGKIIVKREISTTSPPLLPPNGTPPAAQGLADAVEHRHGKQRVPLLQGGVGHSVCVNDIDADELEGAIAEAWALHEGQDVDTTLSA